MKARGEEGAVAHADRVVIVPRQDLDVGTHRFDLRSADENTVERCIHAVDGDVGLEAVDLATVPIPPHGHIEYCEMLLVAPAVEDRVGEQDHSRTRTAPRQAAADAVRNGVLQT